MKMPYMNAQDIALAVGGFSAVDWIREHALAERRRMLDLVSGVDAIRALEDMSHATRGLEREFAERERLFRAHFDSYHEMARMAGLATLDQSEFLGAITGSVEAARLAGSLDLPDVLDPFRLQDDALASRLTDAYRLPWWRDSHLEALNSHAALSGMLDEIHALNRDAISAVESLLSSPLYGLDSLRQTQQFLDISGLLRFPRYRVLTKAEKKRRVRLLVKENAAPTQVRKAHSLTHRYELVLRAVIAQCMEDAYGEDWAAERLPECGCKKLLGKQLEGNETILDHADFSHYAAIVSHADHFETAFSKGFDCAEEIGRMISRVGKLRARAYHARSFTSDDLRELVMLWRAIEVGMIELVDDVVVDL